MFKKIIVFITAAALVMSCAGFTKAPVKKVQPKKNTFTLIIAKNMKSYTGGKAETIVKKSIEIKGKKSAMDYIRDNSSMIEKGGFISSINGIEGVFNIPDSKKTEEQKKNGVMGISWFIYLNDKKAVKNANDIFPVKGDTILIDYHEWDKREFKAN